LQKDAPAGNLIADVNSRNALRLVGDSKKNALLMAG
jgi:hypothetical protein